MTGVRVDHDGPGPHAWRVYAWQGPWERSVTLACPARDCPAEADVDEADVVALLLPVAPDAAPPRGLLVAVAGLAVAAVRLRKATAATRRAFVAYSRATEQADYARRLTRRAGR